MKMFCLILLSILLLGGCTSLPYTEKYSPTQKDLLIIKDYGGIKTSTRTKYLVGWLGTRYPQLIASGNLRRIIFIPERTPYWKGVPPYKGEYKYSTIRIQYIKNENVLLHAVTFYLGIALFNRQLSVKAQLEWFNYYSSKKKSKAYKYNDWDIFFAEHLHMYIWQPKKYKQAWPQGYAFFKKYNLLIRKE